MNQPIYDSAGTIKVRYIISLNSYFLRTDAMLRHSASIWVNGKEHLYKVALLLLQQEGKLSKENENYLLSTMFSFLNPREFEAVRELICILKDTLKYNLLPLLITSGADLETINLISIEEQTLDEWSTGNGIFIFSFRQTIDITSFHTVYPALYNRTTA